MIAFRLPADRGLKGATVIGTESGGATFQRARAAPGASVLSRIPLANARGSEVSILSRDREKP
jgi:hypothetical protein